MTKNELIYTVYEQLKVTSDDNELSREFISSLIDSSRATLIKQTYGNKSWNIPIEIKQELCMGLEPVSNIDGLTCFGKILRTKNKIPSGISIKGAEGAILAVRTYDRKKLNINVVPVERLPLIGHNPYTSGMLYAALDVDSHLYFTSGSSKHMLMEVIKVEGVYEYPSIALDLQCIDKAPIEPWDVDYPLEAAMQDDLIKMVIANLSIRFQIAEDKTNNANDDSGSPKQPKRR